VSTPSAPFEVGSIPQYGPSRNVTISDNHAFVSFSYSGLVIFDLTNPTAPVEVGGYETVGYTYDFARSGFLACVADATAGMTLLTLECPLFADGFESGDTTEWSSTVGGVS